jgi:hypothetical protein
LRFKPAGRDLWVLAMVVLALLCPQLLGAEPKPLIGVEFHIEARNIRRNLHKKIADIEMDLSRLVADLSTDRHEFLTWQPLSQVRDSSQLSAVLHVSLTQDADGAIMLRFSPEAKPAGSLFDCFKGTVGTVRFGHLKDLDLRLFTPLEPQHTGERAVLRARIRDVLDRREFQDTLANVFARWIPLCHYWKPLKQSLVEICLKQSDLDMAENSKMELHLCSLDQGERRGGTLGLDAAIQSGSYSEGTRGELIQGRVTSCKFGDLENDSCKSRIRLMFQRPLGAPDVVMIDFERLYSGTQGKQAARP